MKKINFRMLLVLIGVLITSINTAWAGYNWYGHVFFRAPDKWGDLTNKHVQLGLAQGTSTSSGVYVYLDANSEMTRVGSTRLYHIYLGVNHNDWGKEYVVFIMNGSCWNSGTFTLNTCGGWTTPVDYGFSNNNNPYLYNPDNEDKGATVTGSVCSTGTNYGDRLQNLLNKSQTVNLYTNGGSSNTGGSVNISGKYHQYDNLDQGDVDKTSSSASVSDNCAIGSTVTLTATPADGYCFLGWYTAASDGTQLSSSTTYTYTCTGAKTVYARFAEKLPVGKTLYLATNAKWRENSATFEAVFCNATTQRWETCSLLDGTDDMYSVTVPSGDWGLVIFARMNPSGTAKSWSGKWCQTDDMYKSGLNNCVYITGDCSNSQRWGKYAPVPAIVGTMNNWDPVASGYQFTDGQLVLSNLSANSGYKFKVAVGRDDYWYGYGGADNTNTYVGQTTAVTLTANKSNMALATAGTGNYTFKWNSSDHTLKVEFPSVGHPSTDYVYVKPYSDWDPVNAHLWGGTYGTVYNYDPGLSTVTIYGNDYYYTALGDHNKIAFGQGVSDGHKTESLGEGEHASDAPTSHKGRFYDASGAYAGWAWTDFSATLALDHQSATNTPVPNNITVKFNKSDNLTGDIITTTPRKDGYTFGGYFTDKAGAGEKIIDSSDENVVASVSGYTDSNKKWIRTGEDATTTIYAKWTQTVTLDDNGGDEDGSVDVVYNGTTTSNLDVAERAGYTVEAYYADEECTHKVLTDDGRLVNYTGYVESGKWVHPGATTLYTNWTAKDYTINLEGMEATTPGTTSVNVTFDASTNMTASDPITKPTKTNYDFGGYWVRNEETKALVTQLIDADGKWIADVAGYTSHDGSGNPTWVHDYPISLYAKWTETPYTITMAVSPAGAGTTSPASTATGKLVTESGDITATPAAGYKFKEWQFSKTGEDNDVWCAAGYSSTNATIHIKAQHNGTLTAVFEPRYYLVGGEIMDVEDGTGTGTSSGMPGWDNYAEPFNVITSSPVLATCSLTLGANKHFYIMVRDKADGLSYGKSAETLEDNELLIFANQDNRVLFHSNGGTAYTFKITAIDGSGRPTVSVERPHQVYFGTGYAGIDNLSSVTSGTTGGTLTVTANESTLSNEDWVNYGTDVTYTPSEATGYTFEGFYTSSAYSSRFTQDNPWVHYNMTSDDNVYAKFEEISTAVTLSATNGKIQIGGVDKTSTTCGVTTTRSITAVPNDGYSFSSWSLSSTPDFEVDDTNEETVTLTGHGAGTAGTLTANFSANSYTVTLNNDHGGSASDDGTATAVYDATALSSITNATFSDWTLLGYWNTDGNQVTDASGNLQSSVTNYTSSTGEWKYVGNVTLYAHWSRSVTLDREGGDTGGTSVTVTYKGSSLSGFTAPTKTGYDFAGYYTGDNGTGSMVISTGGELQADVSGYTNSSSQWTKTDATTLYAKWTAKTYTAANNIDKNGGESAGTYTATYNANKITINTEPVYAGYEVDYYAFYSNGNNKIADAEGNLEEGLSGYIDNYKWVYDGYITIYAIWKPKTITVTLDRQGGTDGPTFFSVTMNGNNYDPETVKPTRVGYHFEGYYTEESGEGTQIFDKDGAAITNVTDYTTTYSKWINSEEDLTLYAYWTPVALTTSGSGTAWGTAANWTPACVPTSGHDVTIAHNMTVSGSAEAKSVNITTGVLTIEPTGALEVAGTVTNTDASKLVINTDASNQGALILNNSSASTKATVNLYTKAAAYNTYQFIALPVTYAGVSECFPGSGVYTYKWNEGSGWERKGYYDDFSAFEAIGLVQNATHTYTISGTLASTADISSTLGYTDETANKGINVYGNSWTAPIKIAEIGIPEAKAEQTVYVLEDGSWKGYPLGSAGENVVPAMQAFAIKATASGGSVSYTYSGAVRGAATHTDALRAPQRTSAEGMDQMALIISDGELTTDLRLFEDARFTEEFDNGWEASYLEGDGRSGQLYVQKENKMVVLAEPDLEGTVVGVIQGQSTTYTISFEGEGKGYYLNDVAKGESTRIEEGNTYMFSSNEGNNAARFVISKTPINKTPTGCDNIGVSEAARKVLIDNTIYIIRGGRLYDATGRLVK